MYAQTYNMWYMFIFVCRWVHVYVYVCVSVYVSVIGLCRRPGCVYSLPLWPKLICVHMHTLCISCVWKHCTHVRNTYAHTRTYAYVRRHTHHTLVSRKMGQAPCFSKQQLKWRISCWNTPFRSSCVLYWYSPKWEGEVLLGKFVF